MTIRCVTFVFSMALSIACSANNNVEQSEIVDYAIRAAEKAFASANERARQCTKLKNSTDLLRLDEKELTSLRITRLEAVTAVAYLASRNSWLCNRDGLLLYSFHMGALENLLDGLEIDLDTALGSRVLLPTAAIYPTSMELEGVVRYLKLDQAKRQYFESVFGSDPFHFNNALELNNLRHRP